MNILLTGSTGFIGRNLFNFYMLQDKHAVYAPTRQDLDLHDDYAVGKFFRKHKVDTIIHLAGIARVACDHEVELIYANAHCTLNLLQNCPDNIKFIYASSGTVYGPACFMDLPFTERQPTAPQSVYATSKLCAENLVNNFTKLKPITGVVARLNGNVGPRATHGIVIDFVRKLQSDSETLDVIGDYPGSHKPYLHVYDTCIALMLLAETEMAQPYEVFNVANDDPIFVSQIARQTMKALGVSKEINWLGASANWKGDDNYVTINSNKLKKLGWKSTFGNSENAIYSGVKDLLKCQND